MKISVGQDHGWAKATKSRILPVIGLSCLLVTVFISTNHSDHIELLSGQDDDSDLMLTDPIQDKEDAGLKTFHGDTVTDTMLTPSTKAQSQIPCQNCDESPVKASETYGGLIHDKDSAYDAWNRAGQRLGDLIPSDPDWDEFPSNLVLDPTSDKGELSDALNTRVYDPLDNADINMDDSDDGRLFRMSMTKATGCEVNDKECIDIFIFQQHRQTLAWGKKHSQKWWFWSKAGRKTWAQCKVAGKGVGFWDKNRCDSRGKPEKNSMFWWSTKKGRKMWEQCKNNGQTSSFWPQNHCDDGLKAEQEYLKAVAFGLKFTHKWWFWTADGRGLWAQCQKAGKGTIFWRKEKCGTRTIPPLRKYSKWWWFTRAGRGMWKRCLKERKTSPFWKKKYCSVGKQMYDQDRQFRQLEAWGERYSQKWWRWSSDGARLWARCRKAGAGTAFWRDNKCDTRNRYGRYEQWWWFSLSGRRLWRQCKKQKEGSSFWDKYKCNNGRDMYVQFKDALRIRDRQALHLSDPEGRPWSQDGQVLRLNQGSTLRLHILSDSDVYFNKYGRVALLHDGDTETAVRFAPGGQVQLQPFIADSPEFAWQLYKAGDGRVRIFSDAAGGRYIGYDDATDKLVAVKIDDARKVTWDADPVLPKESVQPPPPRYYPGCDPTSFIKDSTKFTVCMFRSETAMADVPTLGAADSGTNGLYYIGKGSTPVVDFHDLSGFRNLVQATPDSNYAWAIFGELKIQTPGDYSVCTESDDGSRIYVDGKIMADDDGLHGMQERCGTVTLTKGSHRLYIEGFQAGGGVGMVSQYSGPDTGGSKTLIRAGLVPLSIRYPGPNGDFWRNNGNNVRLHTGGLLRMFIYDGPDVYNRKYGRVALFQNGDRNLAVRHANGILYTHPFQPNNYDFAWQFYTTSDGVQIYNDYGGGHYIGYDAGNDRLIIVRYDDSRKVTWVFNPTPASQYVQPLPSRYYSKCSPTDPMSDPKRFTLCMFRSDVGMGLTPNYNLADSGANGLYYVGKANVPDIDYHDLGAFRNAVAGTPDANYAWAIIGQLKIQIPGAYNLCIESDDGSRLLVDGAVLVDNDGLHGMQERCGSKSLKAGDHVVYMEGFQAGGGVGMVGRYSGPDTGGDKVLMRSGRVGTNPHVFSGCNPFDHSHEATDFSMCLFRSEVWLNSIPLLGQANTGENRVYFVSKSKIPIIDLHSLQAFQVYGQYIPNENYVWAISGKLNVAAGGNYNLCISSDDGSKLYVNGMLFVNDDGLHGMVERCGTMNLDPGFHVIYVEGFQCGGGVGMELTYSGPDTGNSRVFMRSGPKPATDAAGSKYYTKCDPTAKDAFTDPTQFTMCMFRSEVELRSIPAINLADTGRNRLYYIGKATIPTVAFYDLGQIRQYIPNTPDGHYAWAIYGQLKIATPGTYTLCISSDDGSRLSLDGNLLLNDDGLHGMLEVCGATTLTAGLHTVYIEGFQWLGGVGQEARYSGPDTNGQKVLILSGRSSSRYFPLCDPTDATTAGKDPSLFTMCTFKTKGGYSYMPRLGDAVASQSASFIGKAQLPAIDLHNGRGFRQYVPNTPDEYFAWAIWGSLQIASAGQYTICITSDDGSMLYVDGSHIINDDGMHGMQRRCEGRFLAAGPHQIYLEGFQGWGGVGQELTYWGPDTNHGEIYMRCGTPASAQAQPKSIYYPACDPTAPGDFSQWVICMFRSEVFMWSIPQLNLADTGRNRLYYIGKGSLPAVDMHDLNGFRQYVPDTPDVNYAWAIYGQLKIESAGTYTLCISSDDGSKLYVDGPLLLNDDGLHGMWERCENKYLSAGAHTIYIEGFQAGGGVGMEAYYSGPDTGNQRLYMRSNLVPSVNAPPAKYYPKCDPAGAKADSTSFTMCLFRSEVWLGSIPAIGLADSGRNRLYYVGQGVMPRVDFHDLGQIRQYVRFTPDAQYAWAIYGQLKVVTAGSYSLCISSDDGSKLYVDGNLLVNIDGLHGMWEQCASTSLSSGAHSIYIEGFQCGGGVGQEAKYSGPDTDNVKVYMLSGVAASRYVPKCDPTVATAAPADPSSFAICTFQAWPGIWRVPRIADAAAVGRLKLIGKGELPVVDMHTGRALRQYVDKTPDDNIVWVIYGSVQINTPGSYTFCISSDDGSKLYVDGPLLVNDDGLHGMVERCGSINLATGAHSVYLEGFQAGGGVGQELRYDGPDTNGRRVFLRPGAPIPSSRLAVAAAAAQLKAFYAPAKPLSRLAAAGSNPTAAGENAASSGAVIGGKGKAKVTLGPEEAAQAFQLSQHIPVSSTASSGGAAVARRGKINLKSAPPKGEREGQGGAGLNLPSLQRMAAAALARGPGMLNLIDGLRRRLDAARAPASGDAAADAAQSVASAPGPRPTLKRASRSGRGRSGSISEQGRSDRAPWNHPDESWQ